MWKLYVLIVLHQILGYIIQMLMQVWQPQLQQQQQAYPTGYVR